MDLKLKDKVAVVTGASKGIGAGIAKAFANAGAKVVVNFASSQEGADKVVTIEEEDAGIFIVTQPPHPALVRWYIAAAKAQHTDHLTQLIVRDYHVQQCAHFPTPKFHLHA